jgi:hypothetical protein
MHSPKPKVDDHEMTMLKSAGPSRNNEKLKRRRMSPYSYLRRNVGDGSKSETEEDNALIKFLIDGDRSGDQVMVAEGLGTLASSPADPTPLTGPQDEVRRE